jgi:hypothetical protein
LEEAFYAAFFAANAFFGLAGKNNISLFFNKLSQLTKLGMPIAHLKNHG